MEKTGLTTFYKIEYFSNETAKSYFHLVALLFIFALTPRLELAANPDKSS